MSDGHDWREIRPEQVNDFKNSILRRIERLGEQATTSVNDDRMAAAARMRAYYDLLKEVEAKLEAFEGTF